MSLQVQRGAGEIRPKAIKELYEEGAAALAQQVPVAELKKYKAELETDESKFPLGQAALVVVDEGHHVFGSQPDEELEGQRRFTDARRVRQVR